MKKFILLVILCLFFGNQNVKADADLSAANLTGPAASYNAVSVANRTDISQCTDTFSVNSEQLFYLTLGVLNKMNFNVEEVQSKTGTVLFKTPNSKEFLVTISNKDLKNAFIKILPTDNNYAFSPVVVQNILSLIKENISVQPINLI